MYLKLLCVQSLSALLKCNVKESPMFHNLIYIILYTVHVNKKFPNLPVTEQNSNSTVPYSNQLTLRMRIKEVMPGGIIVISREKMVYTDYTKQRIIFYNNIGLSSYSIQRQLRSECNQAGDR